MRKRRNGRLRKAAAYFLTVVLVLSIGSGATVLAGAEETDAGQTETGNTIQPMQETGTLVELEPQTEPQTETPREPEPQMEPTVEPMETVTNALFSDGTEQSDTAVQDVQSQIDAFPSAEELAAMTLEEQQTVYEQVQKAYDAYNALNDEQKGEITGAEIFDSLFAVFNTLMMPLATVSNISYIYYTWNDSEKKLEKHPATASECTVVDSGSTYWGTEGSETWYVVNSNVEITSRITVAGDVHLILADSYALNAASGINVAGGNSLTIYGQNNDSGKMTATGENFYAGIGVDNFQTAGKITIHGGTVEAKSERDGAGIGGRNGGAGGEITIFGGKVTAQGGLYGAGIGGGNGGAGGEITISGGEVTAQGGKWGAGIGGGFNCAEGSFTTGDNGNAVIFATAGWNAAAIQAQSGSSQWSGFIFQGSSGQVYGNQEISAEDSFCIPSGYILTIPEGVILTNNGNIILESSTSTFTILGDVVKGASSSLTDNGGTVNKKQPVAEIASIMDDSVTLKSIADGSAKQIGVQYGYTTDVTQTVTDWKDTATFSNITGNVAIFYVQYISGNEYYAQGVSKGQRALMSLPQDMVTIDYRNESVSFNDVLEANTDENFGGTSIMSDSNGSITNSIKTEETNTIYFRIKGTDDVLASNSQPFTIPERAAAPQLTVTADNASSLTASVQSSGTPEFRIKGTDGEFGSWQQSETFTNLKTQDRYTIEARIAATDTSFSSASATVSEQQTKRAAYTITIPQAPLTAGDENSKNTIRVNGEETFDLGYGGHVDVRVKEDDSMSNTGKLKLTQQEGGEAELTSSLLVNESAFTNPSNPIVSFTMANKTNEQAVISFGDPAFEGDGAIPAGTYTGTVTFVVSYSEK